MKEIYQKAAAPLFVHYAWPKYIKHSKTNQIYNSHY